MSVKTISELKNYFQIGDKPKEAEFADLIDSTYQDLQFDSATNEIYLTGQSRTRISLGAIGGAGAWGEIPGTNDIRYSAGSIQLTGGALVNKFSSEFLLGTTTTVPTEYTVKDYVDQRGIPLLSYNRLSSSDANTSPTPVNVAFGSKDYDFEPGGGTYYTGGLFTPQETGFYTFVVQMHIDNQPGLPFGDDNYLRAHVMVGGSPFATIGDIRSGDNGAQNFIGICHGVVPLEIGQPVSIGISNPEVAGVVVLDAPDTKLTIKKTVM